MNYRTNKIEDQTPKQDEKVFISIPMKKNEVNFEYYKEVEQLEETSNQRDVLFNLERTIIKKGIEVKATFVDQGEETEEIKVKK